MSRYREVVMWHKGHLYTIDVFESKFQDYETSPQGGMGFQEESVLIKRGGSRGGKCSWYFLPLATAKLRQIHITYWGGGGELIIVSCGEAPSRDPNPYPFIYHFFIEKVPLSYTFHRKLYPFYIPTERPVLTFHLRNP